MVADEDDAADVFAEICADLSSNDLAVLQRHTDSARARFSTWLVTVVRHRTIDWLRHRDGRRRFSAPASLSDVQKKIFDRVIAQKRTHIEAFELMRQEPGFDLTFGRFMKEVANTYEFLERTSGKTVTRYFPGPPPLIGEAEPLPDHALSMTEAASTLDAALKILPPDERLAVQLFVVEEMSADAVARTVGWPSAKTVYNRVYRALAALRRELERRGVGHGRE